MKLPSQALLGLRDGVLPRIEVLVRSWLACVRERRKEDKRGCGDDICVRVFFAVCSAPSVWTIRSSRSQTSNVQLSQSQDEYGANDVKE